MSLDVSLYVTGEMEKWEACEFVNPEGERKQIDRYEWDQMFPGKELPSFMERSRSASTTQT